MKEYIKLGVRYTIIAFILYLTYLVTSEEYIIALAYMPLTTQIVVGSVFGALTLILKFHFDTKVDK